jgi:hypothetical protein
MSTALGGGWRTQVRQGGLKTGIDSSHPSARFTRHSLYTGGENYMPQLNSAL